MANQTHQLTTTSSSTAAGDYLTLDKRWSREWATHMTCQISNRTFLLETGLTALYEDRGSWRPGVMETGGLKNGGHGDWRSWRFSSNHHTGQIFLTQRFYLFWLFRGDNWVIPTICRWVRRERCRTSWQMPGKARMTRRPSTSIGVRAGSHPPRISARGKYFSINHSSSRNLNQFVRKSTCAMNFEPVFYIQQQFKRRRAG